MRELKFRGLIPTSPRKWVYGGYWYTDIKYLDRKTKKMGIGPHHCILPQVFDTDNGNARAGFYGVISETIGQFTGLKDNNGMEIYEGDIVRLHYADCMPSEIGDVMWFPPHAEFLVNTSTSQLGFAWLFQRLKKHPWGVYTYLEVIGNIHENPELIKK